jgi:hypothetical protein
LWVGGLSGRDLRSGNLAVSASAVLIASRCHTRARPRKKKIRVPSRTVAEEPSRTAGPDRYGPRGQQQSAARRAERAARERRRKKWPRGDFLCWGASLAPQEAYAAGRDNRGVSFLCELATLEGRPVTLETKKKTGNAMGRRARVRGLRGHTVGRRAKVCGLRGARAAAPGEGVGAVSRARRRAGRRCGPDLPVCGRA